MMRSFCASHSSRAYMVSSSAYNSKSQAVNCRSRLGRRQGRISRWWPTALHGGPRSRAYARRREARCDTCARPSAGRSLVGSCDRSGKLPREVIVDHASPRLFVPTDATLRGTPPWMLVALDCFLTRCPVPQTRLLLNDLDVVDVEGTDVSHETQRVVSSGQVDGSSRNRHPSLPATGSWHTHRAGDVLPIDFDME